jgi:hypothetical protein
VRKGCGGRATALERDADSGLGTRFAPGHDVAAAQGTPAEAVIVRAHDGALSSVADRIAAGGAVSGRAVGGRTLPISHAIPVTPAVTAVTGMANPASPAPDIPAGVGGTSSLWAAGDVGNGIGVTPV